MEDVKQLTERMQKDLQSMLHLLEVNMAKIDPAEVPEINQARVDMQEVMKAVQSGDSSKLDLIIQKYGRNNR
jgi:hypothetical protein